MDRIYLTLCPVRLTHFLPSGRYQLAMVPYRGRAALAPPSCSPALERLDLGQHALSVILGRAGLVPSSSPGALCSAAGRGDRDGMGHHRLLQLQGGGHHEQPGARQRARAGRRGEQRRAHARHGPDPRLPARGGRCGQGVLRARRAGRAAAGGECGELVAARAQGPEGDQGRERHLLPRAAQQQQQPPGEARQQPARAPRCCCRPRAGTSSPRRWRCCARTRGTPPPPRS